MIMKRRATVLIGLMLLPTAALARDDGRYASSPLKQWFESLQSILGKCCTDAMDTSSPTQIGNPIAGSIVFALMANGFWCPMTLSLGNLTSQGGRWSGDTTSTAIRASAVSCPAA